MLECFQQVESQFKHFNFTPATLPKRFAWPFRTRATKSTRSRPSSRSDRRTTRTECRTWLSEWRRRRNCRRPPTTRWSFQWPIANMPTTWWATTSSTSACWPTWKSPPSTTSRWSTSDSECPTFRSRSRATSFAVSRSTVRRPSSIRCRSSWPTVASRSTDLV